MPFSSGPAGGSAEAISNAAQSAAGAMGGSGPFGGGGSGAMGGAAWRTSNPQPGGRINIPPPPIGPYQAWAAGPPKDPWASNATRLRRFGTRLNTGQFNPGDQKFVNTTRNLLDTVQRTQEFRRAGIGAAIRHTLGMPQMASGVQDIARARLYRRGEGTYHPSMIGHRGGYGEGPEGPED